ncbi:MAG TPA: hypothetical protein VI685_25910 [Candidatus Angelobacter sp.]
MKAKRTLVTRCGVVCLFLLWCSSAWPQDKPAEGWWRFAVSGDSRNCGDVVMPAIASSVLEHSVDFYWHLGDFRKMSGIDEDIAIRFSDQLTMDEYRRDAWGDFIGHQIVPFGLLPVYLGIGNHELAGGRTKRDYINQFAYWLDTPELHRQRAADGRQSDSIASFHWQKRHVDFISLDNANEVGFSDAQLLWLEGVLASDRDNPDILTVVVGMHRALPNSLACGHSMNGDVNTPAEVAAKSLGSGLRAYRDLLHWKQQTGKHVYVVASHSHFLMERIFETSYWKNAEEKDRGVLPGWIVGTAGAQRYGLPEGLPKDIHAETLVSGYLLGTVAPNGEVQFEFQKVTQRDVPQAVQREFDEQFIETCFTKNSSLKLHPAPTSCPKN